MVKPPHPRTILTAVGSAAGLLLAACGDDTTGSPPADTAADITADDIAADDIAADDIAADDIGGAIDGSSPVDDGGGDDAASPGGLSSGYLGSYTLMDEEFGTMVTVTVDGSTRTIETNARPDHERR